MSAISRAISFRVVKAYSDASGFAVVYATCSFDEAQVARDAAESSAGDPHFIVAVPLDDIGSDYDRTIKRLGMDSK